MLKLLAGLRSLINPKNSEFWSAIIGAIGSLGAGLGWWAPEAWNQWAPVFFGYAGLRITSKVVKA